ERLFVLAPLADLARRLVPPGWHETIETARRRRLSVEGHDSVRAVGAWSDRERAWLGPSGNAIEIRRTRPEDADAAALAHTESSEAAYRGITPPDPDGLARRTAAWRRSTANPAIESYLAIDDGRVVGVLNVGEAEDAPGTGAVRLLYVVPGWWG